MPRYITRYHCPAEATLGVIGGKWKALILLHLRGDTLRFNELCRLIPEITNKMLGQALRDLEHDGIVHREVYPQVPSRVEYSLTEHGRTLLPIIDRMDEWGEEYMRRYGLELQHNP